LEWKIKIVKNKKERKQNNKKIVMHYLFRKKGHGAHAVQHSEF
jgi:hypothetical protein